MRDWRDGRGLGARVTMNRSASNRSSSPNEMILPRDARLPIVRQNRDSDIVTAQ